MHQVAHGFVVALTRYRDDAQNELAKFETRLKAAVQTHASTSHKQRREALLSSKVAVAKPDVSAQSKAANESLLRTRNLMVRELRRVSEASSVLKDDSERLKDVGGEYQSYSSSLKVSQKLLVNMQRRERTDELLMYAGLGFFLCVVAYIVQRRFLPFVAPFAWLVQTVAQLVYGAVEKISSAEAREAVPVAAAAASAAAAEVLDPVKLAANLTELVKDGL